MNLFWIYAVCDDCKTVATWYLETEASDEVTIFQEADEGLARVMATGYRCENCNGLSIVLDAVTFDRKRD